MIERRVEARFGRIVGPGKRNTGKKAVPLRARGALYFVKAATGQLRGEIAFRRCDAVRRERETHGERSPGRNVEIEHVARRLLRCSARQFREGGSWLVCLKSEMP